MSLFDKIVMRVRNVATRNIDLRNHANGYEIVITEHGHERSHVLSYKDVENLQDLLWNKQAVACGIAFDFAPDPNDLYQHFEVPAWAMKQLREDLLNERIHLNA